MDHTYSQIKDHGVRTLVFTLCNLEVPEEQLSEAWLNAIAKARSKKVEELDFVTEDNKARGESEKSNGTLDYITPMIGPVGQWYFQESVDSFQWESPTYVLDGPVPVAEQEYPCVIFFAPVGEGKFQCGCIIGSTDPGKTFASSQFPVGQLYQEALNLTAVWRVPSGAPAVTECIENFHKRLLAVQQETIARIESLDPRGPKFVRVYTPCSKGVETVAYVLESTDGEDGQRPTPIERAGIVVTLAKGRYIPPGLVANHKVGANAAVPPQGATFDAAHLSCMVHPRSPHAPTGHDSRRAILVHAHDKSTPNLWFGGLSSLTPYVRDEEDCRNFHAALQESTSKLGEGTYDLLKGWADEYLHCPHHPKLLNGGGIFFDNLSTEHHKRLDVNKENADALRTNEQISDFSASSLSVNSDSYFNILKKQEFRKWSPEERQYQLIKRARLVEHFFMCDIGFKFGLATKAGSLSAMRLILPEPIKWASTKKEKELEGGN